MIIYPAIDLIEGQCVRLAQGDFERKKVYDNTPIAVARSYKESGAQWLHLIDLDGTKDPKNRQIDLIQSIVEQAGMHVQSGGGIRAASDVEALLEAGVSRVIIGSMAIKQPQETKDILNRFGADRVVLALDVLPTKAGYHVAVSGWQESSDMDLLDVLSEYAAQGVKDILCTDISKDGMLKGTNVKLYQDVMLRFPEIRLQASGGIGSIGDIQALQGITEGVVIGKALYEGKFTLREALSC